VGSETVEAHSTEQPRAPPVPVGSGQVVRLLTQVQTSRTSSGAVLVKNNRWNIKKIKNKKLAQSPTSRTSSDAVLVFRLHPAGCKTTRTRAVKILDHPTQSLIFCRGFEFKFLSADCAGQQLRFPF